MGSAESVRDIATLAQSLKTLIDARAKVRDQERVVFGLDKDKPADPAESESSKTDYAALRKTLSRDKGG
jgi:hypothetical protein